MNVSLVSYYAIGIAATFGAAVLAYAVSLRRGWVLPRWALVALLVFPAYMFIAQFLKFRSLHMYADVSHWLEIIHNIATTWRPDSLTHDFVYPGTKNFLTVHFVPFVYLFGFLHRVWSAPETLLMSNVTLMLSSAIPMYLIAKRRLGPRMGVFAAILLLWYPTFQYTTLYEFEMLRFSMPLLLWMLYYWERRSVPGVLVFALLSALVREEVGLVVALFGVFVALVERRRAIGFVIALVGVGVFVSIVQVAMPALSGNVEFVYYAARAFGSGDSIFAVAGDMVRHPFAVLASVTHPIKLANVAMLFLPFLFLPFLASAALLPAAASIGIGLTSSALTNSSYMLYYIAPAVPFVVYAFLRAWPWCIAWLERRAHERVVEWAVDRVHSAAMVGMLGGVLVVNIFFGPSPVALQFWSDRFRPAPFRTQSFHWSTYRVTDHHRTVEGLVALIPPDAIVSTQEFLMARLYQHRGTMVYPETVSRDGRYHATYILLDATNNGLRPESTAYVTNEEFAVLRSDVEWQRVAEASGFELYKRR